MKLLLRSLAALALLWVAPALSELEVRQFVWGYDNQAVPGTFNPLSVLVSNPSAAAFDGQLELAAGGGGSLRGGERAVAACYLAPGAARWVQFYPFFDNARANDSTGWVVLWGRGPQDRFELDPPRLTAPARVRLVDPEDFTARDAPGLRRFPENLFPPTVCATDGLATAVLDHLPRWEAARRGAFLDWVRRGGTVHLVPNEAGREVFFTDELAPLNSPLDRARVGAGLVVRHHGPGEDVFRDDPAAPTLEKGKDVAVYDLEEGFFGQLSRLTAARVNWALIYWLTALYLAAVGPLHYFWARKRRGFGWSLAVFAGGVTLFALLFGWVGRRGQGETSRVTTLAWARALGDGARCDVMQWSNAFVTDGGAYTLTHAAPDNLYSSHGSADELAGRAFCGLRGRYQVTLPLFSSCGLVHRGVMAGDPLPGEAAGWEADGDTLKTLKLTLPSGFPVGRFKEAFVLFRHQFYPLDLDKDHAVLKLTGMPTAATVFFDATELGRVNQRYGYGAEDEPKESPAPRLQARCARALIARALGGTDSFMSYVQTAPQPDQAELFLLLEGEPAAFEMAGVPGGRETAVLLYQRTLFRP